MPEFAFAEALSKIMGGDHLRRQITTPATVDKWNLEKSVAFYKDRFADASDFTFFFVGSFDLPTLKPFVVGLIPEVVEIEPNNDVAKPQAIASPNVTADVPAKLMTRSRQR